ncbi:MAG: nucleotidyl transferase AbiEii/AbiGii toxin family protein [Candidatus Sericytochromatia bacterium]
MSKNHAASVRSRLLTLSKQRGEPFDAVLLRYGLERLLFRLGQTPHKQSFLLKGGMLLSILSENPYRQTRDLDLLGQGDPDPQRLVAVFQDACQIDYPEDGLVFQASIGTQAIKEEQDYPGVRVQIVAFLAAARLPLQIDVGFGDAVLTPYEHVAFEPLLGFPLPDIHAYPVESVLAEKIHAMLVRGLSTSRMKDIYDLFYLASHHTWSAQRVSEAVQLTFLRRKTAIPSELPIMFTPAFYDDPSKLSQWKAFQKTLRQERPPKLFEALLRLQDFWWPLLQTSEAGYSLNAQWHPEKASWEQS